MDLDTAINLINKVGMPVAACIGLWKIVRILYSMYQDQLKKTEERELKYNAALAECTKAHIEQSESLKLLVYEIRQESKLRQELVMSLIAKMNTPIVRSQSGGDS